jgi:D-alanyl-D-alanine carboxypeptidase (penicillin-binding protein 5/6)
MNERARKLGMSASHFVNPCGLDAPGQYSTVRDLLLLAQAAYEHPQIAAAVAQRSASVDTVSGRRLHFENGNLLLSQMDGVIGMKSGFTTAAGRCLIALARRGTHQVWLVMLDAPQRWSVASGILFEAFDLAAQSEAATQ